MVYKANKVSPIPVHDVLVDAKGIATLALIRFLQDLKNDDVTSILNDLQEGIFKTRELVTTVTENHTLTSESQTILADATKGDITITLPDPITCFVDSRSFRFAIHKVDASSAKINIFPFDAEKVVFDKQQKLLAQGEILNFITDGTDWYLGA